MGRLGFQNVSGGPCNKKAEYIGRQERRKFEIEQRSPFEQRMNQRWCAQEEVDMRRLLFSVAVGLTGLVLTGPAHADKPKHDKEFLKRLEKQQRRQQEFFREQQKRYEEQLRERQKREEEFYREQAKREREHHKKHGQYPGHGFHPPHGNPLWPGRLAVPQGQPYFDPPMGRAAFSDGDLERHIERTIKHHFGRAVEDVDVDVERRRGRIEVEAEVRHPVVRGQLQQLLYSMPELAGYEIRLDIDVDD